MGMGEIHRICRLIGQSTSVASGEMGKNAIHTLTLRSGSLTLFREMRYPALEDPTPQGAYLQTNGPGATPLRVPTDLSGE